MPSRNLTIRHSSKFQVVPYSTVVGLWLDNISRDPSALKWWKKNLALDTVAKGRLSTNGTIELFAGRPTNAPPSSTQRHLYFSYEQVDQIRTILKGVVGKAAARESFESKWLFDGDKLDLQPRQFSSGQEILAFREANSSPTLRRPLPSPPVSRSSTPLSFPAISSKRPLLPTPCTSLESSPEPSGLPKKIKSKHTPEGIERRLQAEMAGAESQKEELRVMREVYAKASREGGAAFLALDIETWERSHGYLLEFGWTFVDFEKREGGIGLRREDQHIIVQEHLRRRNGKYSPDARDHFDFGRSLTLPESTLFNLLHALFETLSSSSPLFLIFHDARSDLRSLQQLGFDVASFARGLGGMAKTSGVSVIDTQSLYSGWTGVNKQIRLETCCQVLEVPTKRLHNAGNDAHYTLEAFERMMDVERVAPVASKVVGRE